MGGGGSSMGMGNYGGGMGRSEGHSYGLGSPNMSNMQGYGGSMGGGGRGNMQDEPAVLMVYGVDHENWNCDKLYFISSYFPTHIFRFTHRNLCHF